MENRILSLRQGWLAWLMAALTFALSVADAADTEILIRRFGCEEANPLWAWFMRAIGAWWILPKLLLNASISVFLLACWRIRLARIALAAYAVVYAAVVAGQAWLMIGGGR